MGTRLRYRTPKGRRRQFGVYASRGAVCLVFDDGTWCVLRGLDIGRVRAALRDKAILSSNNPELDELS